jgi:hypothetical protein
VLSAAEVVTAPPPVDVPWSRAPPVLVYVKPPRVGVKLKLDRVLPAVPLKFWKSVVVGRV